MRYVLNHTRPRSNNIVTGDYVTACIEMVPREFQRQHLYTVNCRSLTLGIAYCWVLHTVLSIRFMAAKYRIILRIQAKGKKTMRARSLSNIGSLYAWFNFLT